MYLPANAVFVFTVLGGNFGPHFSDENYVPVTKCTG